MAPVNTKLSACMDGRLAAYATLAGVVLAAPVIPSAHAAIVWSGPVNITIPSTLDGLYLNVVTGVTGSSGAQVPGWDINPWSASALNFFTPTPNPGGGEMVGTGNAYFNLALGFIIGPNSSYAGIGTTTIDSGTPLHFNSTDNIMGFRFINEAAGGQIQYGWVQISLSGSAASQPRTILSYAYENSGAAIGGFVPEPATISLLGFMAAGGLGVRAWRRRKNATGKS